MSRMSSVRTTTSLAPQTVTDVSTGTAPSYRPRRRDKGRWVDAVTRTQIPEQVLTSALQAAGGDANRLWFADDGWVYVLNHTRSETCLGGGCPACNPK